jgi:hypothetical protein
MRVLSIFLITAFVGVSAAAAGTEYPSTRAVEIIGGFSDYNQRLNGAFYPVRKQLKNERQVYH